MLFFSWFSQVLHNETENELRVQGANFVSSCVCVCGCLFDQKISFLFDTNQMVCQFNRFRKTTMELRQESVRKYPFFDWFHSRTENKNDYKIMRNKEKARTGKKWTERRQQTTTKIIWSIILVVFFLFCSATKFGDFCGDKKMRKYGLNTWNRSARMRICGKRIEYSSLFCNWPNSTICNKCHHYIRSIVDNLYKIFLLHVLLFTKKIISRGRLRPRWDQEQHQQPWLKAMNA